VTRPLEVVIGGSSIRSGYWCQVR